MNGEVVTLDIRQVPVREKHPKIFRTFDELDSGGALLLINDHDPKPLYYQFAAERPGQFDWNYVEQGPEVWKVEIHKKGKSQTSVEGRAAHEHHHFEKATEALKHEHRVIESVLAVLPRLAEPAGKFADEQWKKAIEFIRGFADQCHHLKEEKLLFPALEKHGVPVEGGPIGMMLMEHEEGRSYVRAMAEAVSSALDDPQARTVLAENARAYLRLLREHIEKEDQVLFAIADDVLTSEEQQNLLREFEEHEIREVGSGVHEKYLKIAEELTQ
jgi:hemerythrin-like domain-containing protein/uncharacterized protein (DUF2249 family)